MSPSWYNDIDLWFKKYEFDEQVMIAFLVIVLNVLLYIEIIFKLLLMLGIK